MRLPLSFASCVDCYREAASVYLKSLGVIFPSVVIQQLCQAEPRQCHLSVEALDVLLVVVPIKVRFDEVANPGCIELAMERKNAPSQLRESPHRLSTLLADERPGILYKWIQAAQRFIANGEELGNIPSSVRGATAAMFHEADYHGRVVERLEFGDESFNITKGELLALGEQTFRENGRDPRSFDIGKLSTLLADRGCATATRLIRNGQRKEGWRGVRLIPDVQVRMGT